MQNIGWLPTVQAPAGDGTHNLDTLMCPDRNQTLSLSMHSTMLQTTESQQPGQTSVFQ